MATGVVLKEEEEAWPEVQEEMNRSLATMRVDYDQVGLDDLNVTFFVSFMDTFYTIGCTQVPSNVK